MARMQLFIDWDEDGETAGWQESVSLPLERFQFDDRYADYVSEYISRGLTYLAREVEALGVQSREGRAPRQDGGVGRPESSGVS